MTERSLGGVLLLCRIRQVVRHRSVPGSNVGRVETTLDQVGALLTDHYDGCVRIAGDDLGHDGGVNDTQSLDAVHPQLRVDHCQRISGRAHLGSAHRVVDGGSVGASQALEVLITVRTVLLTAVPRTGPDSGFKFLKGL